MKTVQIINNKNHVQIPVLSRFQIWWAKNKKKQSKKRKVKREENKDLINQKRRGEYRKLDLEVINQERREKNAKEREKEKRRMKLCKKCEKKLEKYKFVDNNIDCNADNDSKPKLRKNKRPLRNLPTPELLEKV